MNIVTKTSTVHTGAYKNRPILYLVIHYTAGAQSKKGTARNVAAMFANPNNRAASADFIVDDGEVVQYNGDILNRYTYAVGGDRYSVKYTPLSGTLYGKCKNYNSISIEMCSTKANTKSLNAGDTDWSISAAVVDNTVELARHLMDKYKIPIERVIMHHHVTGKLCPQPWCLNTKRLAGWEAFKARLASGKENEINMTEKEVRELIQKEVAAQMGLLKDAEAKANNAPEPDWSFKEGHWQRAVEKGVTDGSDPERAAKRDEVVAMLGRLGLF